jgi:hypothetical protein
MPKLTNYTPGPKGVHTVNGLVYIDAGKTSDDLDISDGELKAAKATGWFSAPTLEGDDDADGEGLNGNTVAELKAIAESEEIDLGDATKKADIVAAIELAREAKAAA